MLFSRRKKRSAAEVADIIDRFLTRSSLYPQEWNDFVEGRELAPGLERFRKRCDELDPLVNCPGEQDTSAIAELHNIVKQLREMATQL